MSWLAALLVIAFFCAILGGLVWASGLLDELAWRRRHQGSLLPDEREEARRRREKLKVRPRNGRPGDWHHDPDWLEPKR
jgi:hypothetical protein